MRITAVALLVPLLALAACGRSNQAPAPAPAPVTQVAPVSTAPAVATAPAATSAPAPSTPPGPSSAPAPTSAAAAGTTAAPEAETAEGPEVAGDVTLAQGSVADTATDGTKRQLQDGDNVYPGDSLVLGADSYLDMDFPDGSRILLRPDTTFQIQEFHFEPGAHPGADGSPPIEIAPAKPENAFFRLVKGGLRAIDGLIGHEHPDNYAVETPVATIGVRGTAFDVRYCGDDCKDEADSSGAPENGLYTAVSEGSIGVKNDAGETVTPAGHSGFVKSRRERLRALVAPPKALRHMDLPEKFKARREKMHALVKIRQQQRRQKIIERRKRRAEFQRLHGKAAGPVAQKGAGKETPAERRQQKLEERRAMTPAERRQQRLERIQEKRAGKVAEPGAEPRAGAELQTPAERRQERREQRQAGQKPGKAAGNNPAGGEPGGKAELRKPAKQQKAEPQQAQPQKPAAAAPPKAEPVKKDQPGKDDCKGKKKKKGKDKDKCDE